MIDGWTYVAAVRRRPPCPGPCNRRWREHEQRRQVEWDRVVADVWAVCDGGWSLAVDPDLREERGRRSGDPHWCLECQDRILATLGRFPDLAAALWAMGHDPAEEDLLDADGLPRLRVVEDRRPLRGKRWWFVDELSCGHAVTHAWRPPAVEPPRLRRCTRCILERSAVGAGKIHTTSAGRSVSSRAGSPSSSPSWDAIDELVSWAANTEDRLRGYLRHARDGRDPRIGSAHARSWTLTRAVTYLTGWGPQLLALPEGLEVGRQITTLAARAERAAAEDRLVHRLPATCPTCDLRTLERVDGSDLVKCRRCKRAWQPAEYDWMVRTSLLPQASS